MKKFSCTASVVKQAIASCIFADQFALVRDGIFAGEVKQTIRKAFCCFRMGYVLIGIVVGPGSQFGWPGIRKAKSTVVAARYPECFTADKMVGAFKMIR
jgi:hypothetical protein